ncbi:SHOCT domain-containing protein [Halolamina sediminis]|uniref:SHOCT domain-containing protein n=1 Tax=Halolamina sediminis TaxID=1480675 RepID=UPI0006B5D758|nr:SHOCT domain-containing protein [Halolamina sediminis]
MSDLVHRVAPSSARARMFLTGALLVAAMIGVLSTTMAGSTAAIVLAVLFTVATAGLAVSLGRGLVEQADAAPEEANPAASEPSAVEETADPITTLQQRYAEGELTDEEFERRMERLMESDSGGTAEREEREPAFER